MGPIKPIPRDPDPLPVCKGPEDKPIPVMEPIVNPKPFPGLIEPVRDPEVIILEPIEIPVRDMTEPITIGDIRWL